MLRSMTGYGASLLENGEYFQQWEVRSVNGRFLDLKWRLPPQARSFEPALARIARRHAGRGRIDITLQLRHNPDAAIAVDFDAVQASAMLDRLGRLATERGDVLQIDYSRLLGIPGLWLEGAGKVESLEEKLGAGLELALHDWTKSREKEGQELGLDLRQRLERLGQWLDSLVDKSPQILAERRDALRRRLAEALGPGVSPLNEDRFQQEVVILVDRLDTSEELTRLGAHLRRLGELIRGGGEVGKKLDFTLQECFREINTFGNKLADVELSPLVVDFKNELEKCREQVQNLE